MKGQGPFRVHSALALLVLRDYFSYEDDAPSDIAL